MSQDIDFKNLAGEDFTIDVGVEPRVASGNKLLANIFEVTMLTNIRYYSNSNNIIADNFGGNAIQLLGATINSSNNYQSLYGIIQIIVDRTVDSILNDQNSLTIKDPTERLVSASIVDISNIRDSVSVNIKIVPEEYELNIDPNGLFINIPL
jgi:hypothetical protein